MHRARPGRAEAYPSSAHLRASLAKSGFSITFSYFFIYFFNFLGEIHSQLRVKYIRIGSSFELSTI